MIDKAYMAMKRALMSYDGSTIYVDYYLEQDKQVGDIALVQSPAIFIEFLPTSWENVAGGAQKAELSFNVHLITEQVWADERVILEGEYSDHMPLYNHIYNTLHGASFTLVDGLLAESRYGQATPTIKDPPVILNAIKRTDTARYPHQISNLMKSTQRFTTTSYDYTGTDEEDRVLAELDGIEVITHWTPAHIEWDPQIP